MLYLTWLTSVCCPRRCLCGIHGHSQWTSRTKKSWNVADFRVLILTLKCSVNLGSDNVSPITSVQLEQNSCYHVVVLVNYCNNMWSYLVVQHFRRSRDWNGWLAKNDLNHRWVKLYTMFRKNTHLHFFLYLQQLIVCCWIVVWIKAVLTGDRYLETFTKWRKNTS